jgi:hypothetical protein
MMMLQAQTLELLDDQDMPNWTLFNQQLAHDW